MFILPKMNYFFVIILTQPTTIWFNILNSFGKTSKFLSFKSTTASCQMDSSKPSEQFTVRNKQRNPVNTPTYGIIMIFFTTKAFLQTMETKEYHTTSPTFSRITTITIKILPHMFQKYDVREEQPSLQYITFKFVLKNIINTSNNIFSSLLVEEILKITNAKKIL